MTFSRRQFFGLASATAAGVALGTWVTPDEAAALGRRSAAVTSGPPGPGPVRGGKYGGTVHVAWTTAPNSLDPALGFNIPAWTGMTTLLYTPLYQFLDGYRKPAPALARALPTITNGGRTYRIPLLKGARFSNGRTIVADDYVYSWTRVLDPKVASWASSYLLPIAGSTAVVSGKSSVLAGVKALDDYTLQLTLEEPTFTFMTTLCQPYTAAVPPEAVAALGKNFEKYPIGSGAFIVAAYSTASETATFVRNPHFFWRGLPYLSSVEFHWGVNSELQLLQLEKDTIQIMGTGIPPSLAAQVNTEPSLRRYALKKPENALAWVVLNLKSGKLSDPRVRIALNWAVDRAAFSKLTSGEWTASGYPLPNNLSTYHRKAKPFGYDPHRARSLLAEAGAPKLDFELLTIGGDPWERVCELLQQQLKGVGVTLNVHTVSTTALETITSKTPLTVASYEQTYYIVEPSALTLIVPYWTSTGSANLGSYKNAKVDTLVGEAQAQTTLAKSNEYVAEVEQALTEDPPGIFLYDVGFIVGRNPAVHNYQYSEYTGNYYDRMWL